MLTFIMYFFIDESNILKILVSISLDSYVDKRPLPNFLFTESTRVLLYAMNFYIINDS